MLKPFVVEQPAADRPYDAAQNNGHQPGRDQFRRVCGERGPRLGQEDRQDGDETCQNGDTDAQSRQQRKVPFPVRLPELNQLLQHTSWASFPPGCPVGVDCFCLFRAGGPPPSPLPFRKFSYLTNAVCCRNHLNLNVMEEKKKTRWWLWVIVIIIGLMVADWIALSIPSEQENIPVEILNLPPPDSITPLPTLPSTAVPKRDSTGEDPERPQKR